MPAQIVSGISDSGTACWTAKAVTAAWRPSAAPPRPPAPRGCGARPARQAGHRARPSQDTSRPTTALARPADVHSCRARALMLGEDGALEHHNDRLAHYPLVTADDRIRGVTSAQHHPSA